jgi:hypothetical protein
MAEFLEAFGDAVRRMLRGDNLGPYVVTRARASRQVIDSHAKEIKRLELKVARPPRGRGPWALAQGLGKRLTGDSPTEAPQGRA